MNATGLTARLAIWLVAAVAAAVAEQAVRSSRFQFSLTSLFLHVATAWALTRAAVLVFNVNLGLGESAQQAAAAVQDAHSSKQKQLIIAGLLLGGSMATQALAQNMGTTTSAVAVFKSCTPALVLVISLIMRLQPTWQVWQAIPVLAVVGGAGVASSEGSHIFRFQGLLGPFLLVSMSLLQAGCICLLQQVLQPRADRLPHAVSLGARSSSGSSLRRSSSGASSSSRASDEEDAVTPDGPSPLAAVTYVAWYAMLVLAAPVVVLEAPHLVATFAGWKAVLPTLLASSTTFTLYSLSLLVAIQANTAVTVSLLQAAASAAATLATAFLIPLNINFSGGVVPLMQWQGLAVVSLGLAVYAGGKLAAQRAALQRRSAQCVAAESARHRASGDTVQVMKCSGADLMVYIQPHRVRQAKAAPWVQPEAFQPFTAVQHDMASCLPAPHLQQHQQQQQFVYCR